MDTILLTWRMTKLEQMLPKPKYDSNSGEHCFDQQLQIHEETNLVVDREPPKFITKLNN